MENEKQTTIVLHDVFLARRGKGKGIQQTKTFGIPVYEKDAPIGSAAIDVDFKTVADSAQIDEIITAFESLSGLSQQLIKIGMLEGVSEMLRSETTQAKVEFQALVDYIKQEELHKDDADAIVLAKTWQQNIAMMKKAHATPLTIAQMTENRRSWIEEQKEKGFWRAKLVTVPTPPAVS